MIRQWPYLMDQRPIDGEAVLRQRCARLTGERSPYRQTVRVLDELGSRVERTAVAEQLQAARGQSDPRSPYPVADGQAQLEGALPAERQPRKGLSACQPLRGDCRRERHGAHRRGGEEMQHLAVVGVEEVRQQ